MKHRVSWRAKLADSKDLPKVVPIPAKMRKRWGTGTLVIPSPMEVDSLMRRVGKGKLTTTNEIRAALARKHGASVGCPLVTGIFTVVAAHAAAESEAEGKKRITPYWRTLKVKGEVNPKYPGGLAAQRARLEAEGHTLIAKGNKLFVQDYERKLARLP